MTFRIFAQEVSLVPPRSRPKQIRVPGVPGEAVDAIVGGSGAAEDAEAGLLGSEDVDIEVPPEGDAEPVVDLDENTVPNDLRAEAVSPEHLMTHKPKNPFCYVCLRAKVNKLNSSIAR